jgi:hypothetical protein
MTKFEIDLGVSVVCNLIGWYFYHHVGFKKGRDLEEAHIIYENSDFMSQDWEKNKSKVCLVKSSFDQHFP